MSEHIDFDLDRSTHDAWVQFAERLAEVISVIDDGGSLTIGTLSSQSDPAPFVSFKEFEDDKGDHIIAEASSNASLGDAFQLSVQQLVALENLGWQPPSVESEYPSANFVHVASQNDSQKIAELAVATLRDVFGVQHPVFLAPDQLAEVLQPVAMAEPGVHSQQELSEESIYEPSDLEAVIPADRNHLEALLNDELVQLFGHSPIRDTEGDVAIRVGSSMVFVRATPDARELVVFSALVHEVEGRSRAVEVLNDLNVESRYGRFALHKDRVFVSLSVPALPFVAAHLHQALRVISEIADGIDDDLAAKLRGRTTFTD